MAAPPSSWGTPIELYEHPASIFVAGFIGSPSMNFLPARLGEGGMTLEVPGGDRLTLAAGGLPAESGREITLGIRPEHFRLAGDGDGVLHQTVTLIEHLGADTLVHGQFGSGNMDLTIRLPGISTVKVGERVRLAVEPEHLHLFDPVTERRLG